MDQGKKRRLKRIFKDDGRTVIVPMDHGVTIGPVKGIENMQQIVDCLLKGAVDAVVVHKGIAKCIDVANAGLIVMLSAMSSFSPNSGNKVQVCTVQEAVRLGADAVSVHLNMGAQDEDKMLTILGKVADECEVYGMHWSGHNQNKLHRRHRNFQGSSGELPSTSTDRWRSQSQDGKRRPANDKRSHGGRRLGTLNWAKRVPT